MSLRTEIAPYVDRFGMIAPNLTAHSDNGIMYTSEYLLLLMMSGEWESADSTAYREILTRCLKSTGRGVCLMRDPENDGGSQEGPDDYLGVFAGCAAANITDIPKKILWHGLAHLGSFNNVDGKWTKSSFLWRQPQLITAALFAARWPVGPFRVFFILTLLFAIWQNEPRGNTDARRLGWLLIQAWDGKGVLSRWSVGEWKRWLLSKYPDGMIGVYRIYYEPGHPFVEYVPDFYAPGPRN